MPARGADCAPILNYKAVKKMVSIAQVKKGAEMFCAKEIEKQLPVSKAFLFGTVAGVALAKIDSIAERARESPIVKQLGIISDDGEIDDEALFSAIKSQAEKGYAQFDIPIIGSLSFSPEDVEKLHQYIVTAR